MAIEDNVAGALAERGIVVRYNTFTSQIMFSDAERLERPIRELDRGRITVAMHNAKIKVPTNVLVAAVGEIAVGNSFNPVTDYLESLKWDGTPRIDTWLHDHMGADNGEFERAVGAIFLIAAVRRVRQPGCKFDECLVLVGPEGIGKSSTLRALGSPWFSDSLPLGASPKETVEQTTGVWICESAELVGNTPTKIGEIKAFLSRQEDGPFRAAYAHESEMRPRQFVPVATTNDQVFLHSTTGDRRFWPVRVYFASDKLDRDQLWAEAAVREAAGEKIRLPEKLWDDARFHQEEYRVEDPWETKIQAAHVGLEVTLPRLLSVVGMPIDRATAKDAQRIAGIMGKLGYKKSRKMVDGERTTYYQLLHPFHPDALDRNPKNAPVEVELPDDVLEQMAAVREREEQEQAAIERERAAEEEVEEEDSDEDY